MSNINIFDAKHFVTENETYAYAIFLSHTQAAPLRCEYAFWKNMENLFAQLKTKTPFKRFSLL